MIQGAVFFMLKTRGRGDKKRLDIEAEGWIYGWIKIKGLQTESVTL
jgi:hypothetical protein